MKKYYTIIIINIIIISIIIIIVVFLILVIILVASEARDLLLKIINFQLNTLWPLLFVLYILELGRELGMAEIGISLNITVHVVVLY